MMNRGKKVLGVAFATASLMALSASAHADVKCRATVSKESAKLTQAIAKTLQGCEAAVLAGKLTGPCFSDTGTQDKIQKAKDKLKAAINKACATSNGEFSFGRCPNVTGASGLTCGDILIQSKDGEADCLSCLADHNARELVHRVLYANFLPPASKDIGKCQAAIGKGTLAFYLTASKSLAKCQAALLKGKVSACPDQKTSDAIAGAEAKKVAGITKACCGPDGVCGGAVCNQGTATPVVCEGGTNDGKACATDSACPGGVCVSVATENGGQAATCEAQSDCGRCQGSTTPGKPCKSSGQCDQDPGNCDTSQHKCVGGSNPGTFCTLPAGAECLGGGTCSVGVCTGGTNSGNTCSVNGDCPSIAPGTCVGTTGLCGGVDDLNPTTQIGWIAPSCPNITAGGAPIALTGVTGNTILNCADPQADKRSQCQDAAGATFDYDGSLPAFCTDTPVDCTPTGGTHQVQITLDTPSDLAGVSINLGYKSVLFPGTNDVSGSALITSGHPFVAQDNDDSMTLSITDLGGISGGTLFTITFSDCGAAPTAAGNFGCVVRSASDATGTDIQDGVSCSVSVL